MSDQFYFKFPSTPYLIAPSNTLKRQDKILTDDEAKLFYTKRVTVEEKVDGANLGISFSSEGTVQLQNRGHYIAMPYHGQWRPLSDWLKHRIDILFDVLTDKYIIFGEWCYAKHEIYYNKLPDWFIAFDIYDKNEHRFLPVIKRDRLIKKARIARINQLYCGFISRESLDELIGKSSYGEEQCEGLYLRIDNSDCLLHRAKYVRNTFSQSLDTHWSKKSLIHNQLCIG